VTPTRRAPAFSELGEPAEERTLALEMKLMADAALVGLPNVGKSSLIARLSAARPKVADYPFTTLVPNLGVVRAGEHSFVLADVPGLIEGASEGAGLGHAFLRHIERTALIIHVVDLTGGWEGRDVLEDVAVIDRELASHAEELAERPRVLVGNKLDVPGSAESSEILAAYADECGISYFAVSAATGAGLEALALAVGGLVYELRSEGAEMDGHEAPEAVYTHARRTDRGFEVSRTGAHSFQVRGKGIERMVIMTEIGNEEAVAHLQRRLAKTGVEAALIEAGARDGDEISIAAVTFEFEGTRATDPAQGAIEDDDGGGG